jgi:hypothetical protein
MLEKMGAWPRIGFTVNIGRSTSRNSQEEVLRVAVREYSVREQRI